MEDRRKPVARYVLFADRATQEAVAVAAESAYRDLARADQWSAAVTLELAAEQTVTTKRGLLRRAVEERLPAESYAVTAALAAAGAAALDLPARIRALRGCEAEGRLADTMARVVLELVRDLASGDVEQQRAHPAYRQTVRLAAELQGLARTLTGVGCQDPAGCVRPRPPDQWGRREEDVEIAEVRVILLELANDPDAPA